MTESAIAALAPTIGQAAACRAVGRSRATHHRRHRRSPAAPRSPRPPRPQPRALSPAERQGLLEVLDSERFCDIAPAEVWATLIDEGTYLASVATMYRVLRAQGEVRERRRQRTHPATVKPELVATGPNQCWSWDITKLLGPARWGAARRLEDRFTLHYGCARGPDRTEKSWKAGYFSSAALLQVSGRREAAGLSESAQTRAAAGRAPIGRRNRSQGVRARLSPVRP